MEKFFLGFLTSILLFAPFFPLPTNATSGSCSYHSGVNCSAGPDYDGSVICNDGWKDSSVNFNDTDECKNIDYCQYLLTNFSDDYENLKIKHNLQNAEDEVFKIKNEIQENIDGLNKIKQEVAVLDSQHEIDNANLSNDYYQERETLSNIPGAKSFKDYNLQQLLIKYEMAEAKLSNAYQIERSKKEISYEEIKTYLSVLYQESQNYIDEFRNFNAECSLLGSSKFAETRQVILNNNLKKTEEKINQLKKETAIVKNISPVINNTSIVFDDSAPVVEQIKKETLNIKEKVVDIKPKTKEKNTSTPIVSSSSTIVSTSSPDKIKILGEKIINTDNISVLEQPKKIGFFQRIFNFFKRFIFLKK